MPVSRPSVALFSSCDAAQRGAQKVAEALGQFPEPRFAIPGGSAAQILPRVRHLLGAERWNQVRLTWVDERRIPQAEPESNRGEAYRRGYLEVDWPAARELPLWMDAETESEAVLRVQGELHRSFGGGLDVVLLGLGEDGHVASLFPGRSGAQTGGPEETGAWVTLVDDSPKPPPRRITLTREFLARAKYTIVFALGAAKRSAIQHIIEGDPRSPSVGLPGLTVVTDIEFGEDP